MQTCRDDINNKYQEVSIKSETVSIREIEMNNKSFVRKLSFQ